MRRPSRLGFKAVVQDLSTHEQRFSRPSLDAMEQSALLHQIESIPWGEYAQPEWNKSQSVALALAIAATATDVGSCSVAYDSVLYALGNNHAGTYYPVLLAALPVFESLLRSQSHWSQRGALCILDDLFASFQPEPGYELMSLHGALEDVEVAFRSGVRAFRPLFEALTNEAGPNAELASGLLSLINEDGALPQR